jgi:bacterioferritin-associated ferredoxin
MMLCVCRGVSEGEVGESIAGGAASVEAVVRRCGAGGDCGACHDEIRELLDAATCRPRTLGAAA